MQNSTDKLPLEFELPIGLSVEGVVQKHIELLPANGVAEKIFTSKFPEKPYTWMAYVLCASIKNLAGVSIAEKCRKEFMETGSITIPSILQKLSLADVNTCLVEIHRRIWERYIKNQEVSCKQCGQKMLVDIDLSKVIMEQKFDERLQSIESWEYLTVSLDDKFKFTSPRIMGTNQVGNYEEFDGVEFDEIVFKTPSLLEGIKNEKDVSDSVVMWRKIAFDCCEIIRESTTGVELPTHLVKAMGLKLYNEILSSSDLKKIRRLLREEIPTMPFYYNDTCVCPKKLEVPITMEAGSFFSE